MSGPLLIVFTGPPASGKTSAGRGLAERLSIPLVSKDDLKETLYDAFGHGDDVEEALERAALALAFRVAGVQLAARVPVMIESDFDSGSDPAPLRRLAEEHGARLVQVHMGGDTDAIVEKFVARAESGDRHPGHEDDRGDAEELRRLLESGHWAPLDLPGELYRFDMSEKDEVVDRLAPRLGG